MRWVLVCGLECETHTHFKMDNGFEANRDQHPSWASDHKKHPHDMWVSKRTAETDTQRTVSPKPFCVESSASTIKTTSLESQRANGCVGDPRTFVYTQKSGM